MTTPGNNSEDPHQSSYEYPGYLAPESLPPGYAGAGSQYKYPPQFGLDGQPLPEQKNGWAIAALVLALLSIPAILTVIGGLSLGLAGLIISIVAIFKARNIYGPTRRMGMSIASLIVSIIGILGSLALLSFIFLGVGLVKELGIKECIHLDTKDAAEACVKEKLENI